MSMRSELGLTASNFVLLFVGRLAKEKNIDFLIELMPDLVRKNKRIRLLIVGDGPQRKELEAYSKELGVSDVVRFAGYVPRNRITDAYHSSDVFVFSSLTETQGLVVLEAMAAGKPVVAVPVYGIKYILKEGQGAYLSELNKHEFISRIHLLLDPVEYKKMSAKALRFVQKHSFEKSTEVILSIYKSLIRQKKRV
jgi:1,2-diacylglycerol 3-alpha-glucosyltransferase